MTIKELVISAWLIDKNGNIRCGHCGYVPKDEEIKHTCPNCNAQMQSIMIEEEEIIDSQHTVDVQPIVHAHWEYDPDITFGFKTPEWKCSNCHVRVGEDFKVEEPTDYCPYCGAKMDEVIK